MNGRLSDAILTALVKQAQKEKYNSNVYSSMANNLSVLGYRNSATYMENQSHEEQEHFSKIWTYITNRNCKAALDEIEAVPSEYDNLVEAFSDAQTLEFQTTEEWKKIYALCIAESDWMTKELAMEFMQIQYKEETEIMDIYDSLKNVKSDCLGIWDNTFKF